MNKVNNIKSFLLINHPIRWMIETSLLISLSVIIYFLSSFWSKSFWPQGGIVGIQFIPIVIAFYRLDFISTILVAFFGLIIYSLFEGFYIVNPWQFLLDYCSSLIYIPIASFGAYYFKKDYECTWKLCVSISIFTIISLVIHFVCVTCSSILFFSSYAPTGKTIIVYSLVYNSTYLLPSYFISLIIILASIKSLRKMFYRKDSTY